MKTLSLSILLALAAPLLADPLSPVDELKTFQVNKGFAVQLVASEPDVIDPVAHQVLKGVAAHRNRLFPSA